MNLKPEYGFDYIKIFTAAIMWTFLIYSFIWPLNYFIGIDAYYHIEIAVIMKNFSVILDGFPWADCSVWKNNFFDKDWLFHLYLIPFLQFGKLTGGKIAVLTAVFLSCVTWGILLKSLKIKNLFFTLILMVTCFGFYSRMFMCRGHLLSIVFLPLCLACIVKRKQVCLFIFTLFYAYAYAGAWQVIFLAFFYDFLKVIFYKEKITLKQSSTVSAFLAILISLILNPYFPNNISGLIIQNIFVLKTKWFGNSDTVFYLGNEFNPINDRKLYTGYFLFFVLLLITFGNCIRRRENKSLNVIYFAFIALLYFILSLISIKFSDYSVPVGFVFIVVFWDDWFSRKRSSSIRNKRLISLLYVLLLFYVGVSAAKNNNKDFRYSKPLYSGAAEWLMSNLGNNVKNNILHPEKIVFTGGWDDAPMLFYGAPQYKYLVFLDPCFMYIYSPEKYKKWLKIIQNKTLYPAIMIYKEFSAEYIFLKKDKKVLAEVLEQSPYAQLCYTGEQCEKIFRITVDKKQLQNFESINNKYKESKVNNGR